MRPLALKWRISLLVALMLLAVIAIISVVVYVELREALTIVAPDAARYTSHEMREFLALLVGLGGTMVVVGAILSTLIVLWGLRPIRRTAARLRGITERNLGSEDFAGVRAPAELRPFISALSETLARLNGVLRQQRQFTADASHELRTPLALAKSTLQAARLRGRTQAEYERAIDETLGDLDRMDHLMSQLLVLARLDESEDGPESAEVPLDAVLARVVADHAAKAAERGVALRLAPMPPVRIRGSEDLLGRLFGNLVENAVIHGPRGGTVRITLSEEADGRRVVCVHDEGGAILAEALPHLFDRFYRSDASRARTTGGTGLGLAIAREIALRHGGGIEITSSPAAGTRARVSLPSG